MRLVLGYLLAAACLLWVFHGVQVDAVMEMMRRIDARWVLPAILCETLSFVVQGLRWRYLLAPLGRLPVLRAAQAIYVGLLVNQVLPMRVGELARAYLASRWMCRPAFDVFPSVLFSRLLDGAWITISILLVAVSVDLPGRLFRALLLFAAFILALAALFLLLLMKNPASIEKWVLAGEGKHGRVMSAVRVQAGRMALGLRRIGTDGILSRAVLFTMVFLLMQVVAFWAALHAFRLPLSFPRSAAAFLIVIIGVAVPTAPTSVGPSQFFIVLALELFKVSKAAAAGFAVFAFAVLTLPVSVIGLISLATSGVSLAAIRAGKLPLK